jgi:CheY-like chemotaxis protein
MALDPNSRTRFNLSKTVVLLLDPTPLGLSILGQILKGLGARHIHRCQTIEQAKEVATTQQIDLMLVDSISESGEGYEFVRWLRKSVPPPNRHAPILLTTGHTRLSDIATARDCGSHFILAKPLSPIVVLERIIWIAREGRPFLLSDGYVGPDRRANRKEPPVNHPRRRHDDPAQTADNAVELEEPGGAMPDFIDRPLERAS